MQRTPQLDNATEWPPNAQFNMFGTSGVLNLTSCMKMPMFVSFPEFLGAEELAANNTKMGLNPKPSWDSQPTIDVEPMTGAVYKANNSLQLNTIIHSLPFDKRKKRPGIDILDGVLMDEDYFHIDRIGGNDAKLKGRNLYNIADDLIVPMVLMSECSELPDHLAESFATQVVFTMKCADELEWLGAIFGCLFALWATGTGFCCRHEKQKSLYTKRFVTLHTEWQR